MSISEQSFVPRLVYGRYLQEILQTCEEKHPNLKLLTHHIVSLRRGPQGFILTSEDGQTLTADRVVLALGNFPPQQTAQLNPYMPETWHSIAGPGDILIVGTGLTSLDLVVTLAKTKPSGIVHLLSRHGLLPREHIAARTTHVLTLKPPYPITALGLWRAIRHEIASATDAPWQSVIDALRPLNQKLWQSLNSTEQRRFLRHVRAYWDVHRHRCAPQVMSTYRALERQGRLRLHHGTIVNQVPQADGFNVLWRPRGQAVIETLNVRYVVRCTGPQADFRKLDDRFVQDMIRGQMICPDALHLGIETASDNTVCDDKGSCIDGLYAIGSLLKGRLYESVAVPELRQQAFDIATDIASGSMALRA